MNNLILPQNENYKSNMDYSFFEKKKFLYRTESINILLKKIDINLENLKSLKENKLNELEKNVQKLDNLDLNKNNFYGLFSSKIMVNTNKNAVGNLNELQNLEEKKNMNGYTTNQSDNKSIIYYKKSLTFSWRNFFTQNK